jgi:hypothetical protein
MLRRMRYLFTTPPHRTMDFLKFLRILSWLLKSLAAFCISMFILNWILHGSTNQPPIKLLSLAVVMILLNSTTL